MNARPYHNEPGFEVARDPRDVHNYNDCISYERLRVGVVDMVGGSTSASMPKQLRDIMVELFPSFFDLYMLACTEGCERGKDGASMVDPFGQNRGRMEYSSLRCRLEALLAATSGSAGDSAASASDPRAASEDLHPGSSLQTQHAASDGGPGVSS